VWFYFWESDRTLLLVWLSCFLRLIFLWFNLAWLNASSRICVILSTLRTSISRSICFSCSSGFSRWSLIVNLGSHWFRWDRVATTPGIE
jgi:hypothetical protein